MNPLVQQYIECTQEAEAKNQLALETCELLGTKIHEFLSNLLDNPNLRYDSSIDFEGLQIEDLKISANGNKIISIGNPYYDNSLDDKMNIEIYIQYLNIPIVIYGIHVSDLDMVSNEVLAFLELQDDSQVSIEYF